MNKKFAILIIIALILTTVVYAAPTANIFRTILPEADSLYDLGSTTVRWANGFFDNLETTTLGIGGTAATDLNMNGNDIIDTGDIQVDTISAAATSIAINNDVFTADNTGFVIGHTAQIDFGATPEFQVLGTSTSDSSMGFARFENNSGGADVRFLKSRGASIGTNTIVQDNDFLGRFRFQGADGNDFNTTGAQIHAEVDGAPGLNDLPTALVFSTTIDGASSVTERLRIDNAGNVGIGTATPATPLDVVGITNTSVSYSIAGLNVLSVTGTSNVFVAIEADDSITTGSENTSVGTNAGKAITSGRLNTIIGANAGDAISNGLANTLIGKSAGSALAGGSNNVLIGRDAGATINGESDNVFIGYLAGLQGGSIDKSVIIGSTAGQNADNDNNIYIGYSTGSVTSTGGNNILLGYDIELQGSSDSNTMSLGNLIFGTGLDGTGTTLSSGNVGVGVAAPASLLEIQGGLTTTGAVFTLGTKETTVEDNDIIGRINFYAPLEAGGSDAILVGASIHAEAEAEFTASVNSTALVFSTGTSETAVERMRIDELGRVGIGTASPASKLEVKGAVNTALGFQVTNTTSGTGAYAAFFLVDDNGVGQALANYKFSSGYNSNGYYIAESGVVESLGTAGLILAAGNSSGGNIRFYAGGTTERMRIDTAGLVGIGTTTPVTTLDIVGSTRIKGSGTVTLTGTIDPIASTTVTGVNTLFTTELIVGDRIVVTGETKTVTAIASATSLTVDTAFSDNGNDTSPDRLAAIFVVTDDSDNVDFIVQDNGNVGVGTVSPIYTLHAFTGSSGVIASGSADDFVLENNGNSGMSILTPDASFSRIRLASPSSANGVFLKYKFDDALFTIGTTVAGHELSFETNSSDEAMRIDSSGNVGIGTNNPSGLLQLNGGMFIQDTVTIAVDDTTPDVSGGNIFTTSANDNATAITDLDLPQVGQIVYIIGGSDTNSSTIADSGNFNLSAAFTASLDDILILLVQADNDYLEIGRVDN